MLGSCTFSVYTRGCVQVLKAKSCQYLTDYHLWLSSFVKPSYSRFTRSQRLTCCLCLLMSYMTVSALWFHYFTDEVLLHYVLLCLFDVMLLLYYIVLYYCIYIYNYIVLYAEVLLIQCNLEWKMPMVLQSLSFSIANQIKFDLRFTNL